MKFDFKIWVSEEFGGLFHMLEHTDRFLSLHAVDFACLHCCQAVIH